MLRLLEESQPPSRFGLSQPLWSYRRIVGRIQESIVLVGVDYERGRDGGLPLVSSLVPLVVELACVPVFEDDVVRIVNVLRKRTPSTL